MSQGLLFATGPLSALAPEQRQALLRRAGAEPSAVRDRVAAILNRVRREGDAALLAFAREFDGVDLQALEVPRSTWDAALARLEPGVRAALERAARNIAQVHAAFAPSGSEITTSDGVRIGRRPDPLQRVGVYAPGGRAAYPSSVLMGVVPARIAGVTDIVVCTPPTTSGVPSDVVLAAAAIGGATRVFAAGGAGAIGAMAFGTASVPRVDRIIGPGNAYVSEAKAQVASVVGIDVPAGPSELLVLADDGADPRRIAMEMFAQAEHDPRASVVTIGLSAAWADRVSAELDRLLRSAPRADIIASSLRDGGAVCTAHDVGEAIAFANEYAAEHALLAVRDAEQWLPRVRNAGTVFLGDGASVAFGDYLTGANHVLPTGGLGRSYSGLSPLDFVRWTTWQFIDPPAARRLAGDTNLLARAEGLPAHAEAAAYSTRQ